MKDTVVLYAGMGVGQLVPMVALAKLFLRHNLAVTIVAVDPPMTWGSSSKVISSFASANPSISFHLLPTIPIPAEISHCPFDTMFDILRGGNSNLLDFLVSISKTTSIRAVVIALFCTATLDVTKKLGIPTYFFMTTSASDVAASLQAVFSIPYRLPENSGNTGYRNGGRYGGIRYLERKYREISGKYRVSVTGRYGCR
ncbi:Glycosyltransferase [Rhynchospora pubera]|uniref:Glycosyltransferase n=1 Tax=Rhynchospora pubera TaxID=906938 RepID=A0AAV8F5E3_9POAL|nr:Glycosyltransferase [Rhynchospora pubera]